MLVLLASLVRDLGDCHILGSGGLRRDWGELILHEVQDPRLCS